MRLRMCWRHLRSASEVTLQVFTTQMSGTSLPFTTRAMPLSCSCCPMVALSEKFNLHPRVTNFTLCKNSLAILHNEKTCKVTHFLAKTLTMWQVSTATKLKKTKTETYYYILATTCA